MQSLTVIKVKSSLMMTKLAPGFLLLATGFWNLVPGHWLLATHFDLAHGMNLFKEMT